jgi:uncharacterized membrane protein
MLVAGVLILWLQRGTTYGADELLWLQWAGIDPTSQAFHPYNGHLIAIPLLVWKGVLLMLGLDHSAFAVVEIGFLLACAGLLFELGRRRIDPWLAFCPAVLLLFLGSPLILQPLLSLPAICSVAFGLAALLALERDDQIGNALCACFLVLSLFSFSISVAFVAAATVRIVLRDSRWRSLWAIAVPAAVYLGWRLWAAHLVEPVGTGIELSNVRYLPFYFSDSLVAVSGSLFGLLRAIQHGQTTSLFLLSVSSWEKALAVGLCVVAVLAVAGLVLLARRRRPLPVTLWPTVTALFVLWLAGGLALAEGRLPAEQRYIFPGVVAIMLVVVELSQLLPRRRSVAFSGLVITAVAILANVPQFEYGRNFVVEYSRFAKPDLTAFELAGSHANPAFNPGSDAPGAVSGALYTSVGPYLELVRRYGSPALPLDQMVALPEDARGQVDNLLVILLGLHATPGKRPAPPGCRYLAAPSRSHPVPLPPGGALLAPSSTIGLDLRRFTTVYYATAGRLQAKRLSRLRIPPDHSDIPWRIRQPAEVALKICPIDAAYRER